MTLPSSGSITAAMINVELGRSASAAFNINDSEVRALAGIPSGPISFSDFYGKANEIVVTLSSRSTYLYLKSLFSAADWASDVKKRVIIPSGVELGTNTTFTIATSATADGQATSWGGDLYVENNGIISGLAGAANSGAGGSCVYANLLGRDGQKMNVINNGTIRAGGGGGGKGGTGGPGYYTSTSYGSAEGPLYSTNPWSAWQYNTGYGHVRILWKGDLHDINYSDPASVTSLDLSGYHYTRGSYIRNNGGDMTYYISRQQIINNTNYTTGGAGGAGGVGQGYGQSRASGSAGAAGGTNAGKGGTGGTGGTWGTNGGTGATGASGNNGSGSAGSSGGAAGHYLLYSQNINFTNNGTVQGTLG